MSMRVKLRVDIVRIFLEVVLKEIVYLVNEG